MYHIPKDRRAERSAEALYGGLVRQMQQRKFRDITVSEIAASASVSRATFYRLFDNMTDIILWRCESVMRATIVEMRRRGRHDFKAAFSFCFDQWRQHLDLLILMERNHQLGLLVALHEKYIDEIQDLFFQEQTLPSIEKEFLISALVGLVPMALKMLTRYPQLSKAELYGHLRKGFTMMAKMT